MRKVITTIKNYALATFIIIGFLAVNGYNENYYTMNCEVIEVVDDVIYILDSTNNMWGVCAEGVNVGDTVKATFFTNYTNNNRLDDEVTDFIIK